MKLKLIFATCVLAVTAYEPIKLFNSAAEPRIISGTEASDTDFPHHAALFVTQDGKIGEICGGALLTEDIVLTAAHCFDRNGKQGYTFFGSNRYFNGTKIAIKQVIVHEDYFRTNTTLINDIALLKLEKPIKIDGVKFKTIALNSKRLEPDTHVTVSGFGKFEYWEDPNGILYYTNLTTISNEKCKDQMNEMIIGDKVVCLKGKNREATCEGDSGGALLLNWPENPTHVGIVSFGVLGCMDGFPVVFTRTADYIDWILENAKLL